jgi:transcriptional regulator with XRE-family HTH domain
MPAGRTPDHHNTTSDPRLARRLGELRNAAGITGEFAAAKAGWSPSKISRIEHMRTGISPADVIVLLDLYDVEGPERTALTNLAERASSPSFKGHSRPASAAVYRDEAAAADIWAPSVIPPPLRTAEYARAVAVAAMDITGLMPSGVDAEEANARAWRRLIEARRDPLQVKAVIDATALRRRAAGPEVMHRQAAHLAALAELSNVTLLVVPIDSPAPPGFPAFTLLQFDWIDGMNLHDVALFDDYAEPRIVDEETVTWRCRRAVRELAAAAQPAGGAIAAALSHWSR